MQVQVQKFHFFPSPHLLVKSHSSLLGSDIRWGTGTCTWSGLTWGWWTGAEYGGGAWPLSKVASGVCMLEQKMSLDFIACDVIYMCPVCIIPKDFNFPTTMAKCEVGARGVDIPTDGSHVSQQMRNLIVVVGQIFTVVCLFVIQTLNLGKI